ALLTAATSGSSNTITIAVPNVSPEAFAPLLTFMYTGYLDVTHDNIYGVLLATHLLHMPRALDLCRAFLVQNQQPQTQSSLSRHPPSPTSLPTLVKPIPSRKMLPILLGLGNLPPPPPPPAPFWPPPTYHHTLPTPQPPQLMLPSADNSPFRSVLPTSMSLNIVGSQENHEPLKLLQPPPSDFCAQPPSPQPTGNNTRQRPRSPLAIPSTSTSRRTIFFHDASPSTPSSVSPCLSGTSFSSDDHNVNDPPADKHKSRKERSQHQQLPQKKYQQSSKITACKKQQSNDSGAHGTTNSSNSKVIIDVACCDGPVRFHRVLNDNYGLTLDDILAGDSPEGNSSRHNPPLEPPLQNNQELGTVSHIHKPTASNTTTDRNNSIKEASSAANLSDGNTSSSSASVTSERVGGSLETVYTCLYCNHTFKSHYCYQKHARRHINPVTIDVSRLAERLGTNKGVDVCKVVGSEKDKANGSGAVRREVRLLDMNVQYYPCKTCGSKFPSYYFVHKHRKMCHANEE
ncbi:Zinc finger and BTB domain-containing protein 48, partial [Zootermopsis nevadensis]